MCGINGFIDKTGKKDLRRIIQQMNQLIFHRGPDDSGVWINEKLGMGIQRLSIIDLKSGHQPMHNSSNKSTIVFNGEIYNYLTLRVQLETKGYEFITKSDTEVILKLYQEYGTDSFRMLDGMFAFSIFDPNKNKIFCVRDFFGEKPLYYFSNNSSIAWSSELKSLVPLFEKKPSIDSEALSLYFRLTYIPPPFTIYNGIQKLEANHYLTIELENNEITKYPIEQLIETKKTNSKNQAIQYTHDLVMESVSSRMVADVPLASFLSGGVDSSIISLCLSKLNSQRIDTFSIGFNNPLFDESKNARTVAKTIGSKHHSFICNDQDIYSITNELLLNFDEPFADSSALASYWVSHHTAKYFKVALTGDGGDEIFGGYNKYLIGKLSNQYIKWVPRPIHKLSKLFSEYFLRQRDDKRGIKYKTRKFLNAMDSNENPYLELISLGLFDREYRSLFNPKWQQKDVFKSYRKLIPRAPKKLNDFKKIDSILSLDGDLLTKVDRTSMLSSIECRAPFLKKSLWDFSLSLPEYWHIYKGDKKHLLKSAFSKYFPDLFFHQPKKGFNVPIGNWLRTVYRKELLNFSETNNIKKQGIFNSEIVQRWVEAHLDRKEDYSFQLWTFFCFQLWYFNIYQSS